MARISPPTALASVSAVAAVNAVKSNPESVTQTQVNGATVLTIPAAGTQIKATLGADRRVVHAEISVKHPVLGYTLLAADFSGYKDFDLYDVFAPQQMKFTLGG